MSESFEYRGRFLLYSPPQRVLYAPNEPAGTRDFGLGVALWGPEGEFAYVRASPASRPSSRSLCARVAGP